MSGHGWVTPLPSGAVARCGGPGMCPKCQQEAADLKRSRAQPTLAAIRVEGPEEIEWVRQIRNICAAGFSTHNDIILPEAHEAWWERTEPLAWIYSDQSGSVVGFGMLRPDDQGRTVSVVAVLPEFSGRGYGGSITRDVIRRAPGLVYASARLDNPAAIALHCKADWKRVAEDGRLAYFETWGKLPDWPGDEAIEQWSESGWAGEAQ